ncbi:MAG: MFS transporter [Actinomycetia bacterium]|nr:MFS transporter [Actinomycetes bacterium]
MRPDPSQRGSRRRALAAFEAPHFPRAYASGAFWNVSRWATAFLGAFVVNDLTSSPRMVQLTGTALWAPLLVGGIVGGLLADRLDRRRTLLTMLGVLIPASALMGILDITNQLQTWMVYVYLLIMGMGWVGDMTSRRTLVFDLVGTERLDNAMALEMLSSSGGIALGTLAGGSLIEATGTGAAFIGVSLLLSGSFVLLATIPSPARRDTGALPVPARQALAEGFGLTRRVPLLLGVLGVTVVANFFMFSYLPIVPVLADRMDARPILVGLLASATGFGMATGAWLVAHFQPRRRGLAYVGGSAMAMVVLIPFAFTAWYPGALVLLYVSSIGAGLFGSTQSTLVMMAVPEGARGRALGLLSMSIGALPVGMFTLGELAERLGAPAAVAVSASAGLVALALWSWRHPATVGIRAV